MHNLSIDPFWVVCIRKSITPIIVDNATKDDEKKKRKKIDV
jgi:hypothetical protein